MAINTFGYNRIAAKVAGYAFYDSNIINSATYTFFSCLDRVTRKIAGYVFYSSSIVNSATITIFCLDRVSVKVSFFINKRNYIVTKM